jgi:hypothetical protein
MLRYAMLMYLILPGLASLTLTSLSLLYRLVNVLYIWTISLLLKTFCHACSCLVTLCEYLLYILGVELYTAYMTLVDAT